MVETLFRGSLLADYHQFYLCDEAIPVLPDAYSDAAIARRLMAGPHGIIVHCARNLTVPIRVEWYPSRPDPDLAAFQHMAETGFASSCGRLVLAGLTDFVGTAARLPVQAGPLGARACFAGLDTLDAYGIGGEDRYLVQLWPGPEPAEVRVLKAWPPK